MTVSELAITASNLAAQGYGSYDVAVRDGMDGAYFVANDFGIIELKSPQGSDYVAALRIHADHDELNPVEDYALSGSTLVDTEVTGP